MSESFVQLQLNYLKLLQSTPVRLYTNSTCLTMAITYDFEKVGIAIAKGLDGAFGKPKKGIPKYNHDRASHYSLSINDCLTIEKMFPSILSGKYINEKQKGTKYENVFGLTNFREIDGKSAPSHFTMSLTNDSEKKLVISIVPPKDDKNMDQASFTFTNIYETRRFYNFIKKCGEELDFQKSIHTANNKFIRKMIYDHINSEKKTD